MSNAFKPILVIGSAVVLLVIVSLYSRPSGNEIIPWRDDYAGARNYAAQSGKLMMVDFTADWCGPCNYMKGTTWASPAVKEALKSYVPVRVDVDRNKELAKQFQISSIPHLFIVNADGRILREMAGAATADEFIEWINVR